MSKTHVPLDQLRDNPHQPRLDVGDIDSLAETILEYGLRQLPEARLLVDGEQPSYSAYTTTHEGEWYLEDEDTTLVELASGHRRVEAIRQLNLDDTVTDGDLQDAGLTPGYVPVDLQRLSGEEMLDLLTIENAHRKELSPIEEARLIGEMVYAGRDAVEIAERFGKSQSWVSNRKRLTTLPVYVQEHVHDGEISIRQGMALAAAFAVEDEHPQLVEQVNVGLKPRTMAGKAMRGHLTSDDIRERTKDLKKAIELAQNAESEEGEETTFGSDRHKLPGEWQWEEGCPEASAHGDDGGYQAMRKWLTANGSTVRSRVSGGQKEKVIQRAHKHENNLCRDYLLRRLAGKAKPSLPDGWVWEITRFVDGVPQIGAFRYKGEPTCPAGWSASADGEDIYEKVQEAIRIEEKGESFSPDVGTTHPQARAPARSETTTNENTQTDESGQNHEEAETRTLGPDAGTRAQEDIHSEDGDGPERASGEELAAGSGVDEAGHHEEEGASAEEVEQSLEEKYGDPDSDMPYGHEPDGTPSDGMQNLGPDVEKEPSGDGALFHTVHQAYLRMVIDAVEADGHDWQLKTLGQGSYEAMVQVSGTSQIKIAEGSSPADALQDAYDSARGPDDDIGQVVPEQVDTLLSADGEEMWDEEAAEIATIASLLVAHRVAGARQEQWRTQLITDVVRGRAGKVTSQDVPDSIMADVQSEVDRRLETAAA